MIYYILLYFAFLFCTYMLKFFSKKASIITVDKYKSSVDIVKEMLAHYNIAHIEIIESNKFAYNPLDNTIALEKDNNTSNLNILIPSLHEVGHSVIFNKKSCFTTISKIYTKLLIFNRVFIIPMYICLFGIWVFGKLSISNIIIKFIIKYLVMYYFYICSTLRLTIGLLNEYKANQLTINFIKEYYKKIDTKLCKNMMIFAFLSQFFLALAWIVFITFIIYKTGIMKY